MLTGLDHDCPWKTEALGLRAKVLELQAEMATARNTLAELERRRQGRKSERVTPPERELRPKDATAAKDKKRRQAEQRREHADLRATLHTETILHPVAELACRCPQCGGVAERLLGKGERTVVYEYIPGHFKRQVHIQQKLACRCGKYIAVAAPPPRPLEKGLYGPGLLSHIAVMKCADSIPLHRLAKQYQRVGIPMARSTLTDLFHSVAERLRPLWERVAFHVAQCQIVLADETPLKMQRPYRRGYVWTFLSDELILYRFSADRSGQTPQKVLGGTQGTLVVDAYTGYNSVTTVKGRQRAGCLAHARRKFFEALPTAPMEAKEALALILEVYRVEHMAKAQGIVRTEAHHHLRQTKSREAMAQWKLWLEEQQARQLPKSPLGEAIRYALNQWQALTQFLDDVRVPVDNNASERALRVVALGRKNFLFVGHAEAGERLSGLYTLISSCTVNQVDPMAYLQDVLMRVDTHPASRIDELLPHRWKPPSTL